MSDTHTSEAFWAIRSILKASKADVFRDSSLAEYGVADRFWQQFIDVAMDQKVAPALAYQFEALNLSGIVPSLVERFCDALLRINRSRNAQISREALDVALALNEIDIVPLFLRGCAGLLSDLYDDTGMRIMSDIDMLVRHDQADECAARLESLGYQSQSDNQNPGMHTIHTFTATRSIAPVDLYREILTFQHTKLLQAEDVFAQAIIHEQTGARFAIAGATHQVMINIVHAQLQNRSYWYGDLPLRSLMDLALLQDKLGEQVDWQDIRHRFATAGYRTALEYHCLAAHELMGVEYRIDQRPRLRARLLFRYAVFLMNHLAIRKFSNRALQLVRT